MPFIQGKILEEEYFIHTDDWKAYDVFIINKYTHYRFIILMMNL
jgi:hypothetical protein